MATVIDQILSIDSIAQKKLDFVTEFQHKLKEETNAQIAETTALYTKRAEEEVQKKRIAEQEQAEKEIQALLAKKEQAISKLEKAFEKTHDKLAEDIYQNVIRGSLG